MNLKNLMIVKAAVCLGLGAIILVIPDTLYSLFDVSLGDGGMFAAREYGAALMGNLMITWFARSAVESDARRAIIMGLCLYDAIGVVITAVAVISGVMNALGWLIVALYLFFAVGFGYFLVYSPERDVKVRAA